jgi:hypothetical protein
LFENFDDRSSRQVDLWNAHRFIAPVNGWLLGSWTATILVVRIFCLFFASTAKFEKAGGVYLDGLSLRQAQKNERIFEEGHHPQSPFHQALPQPPNPFTPRSDHLHWPRKILPKRIKKETSTKLEGDWREKRWKMLKCVAHLTGSDLRTSPSLD